MSQVTRHQAAEGIATIFKNVEDIVMYDNSHQAVEGDPFRSMVVLDRCRSESVLLFSVWFFSKWPTGQHAYPISKILKILLLSDDVGYSGKNQWVSTLEDIVR